jgi:hypothetical protein
MDIRKSSILLEFYHSYSITQRIFVSAFWLIIRFTYCHLFSWKIEKIIENIGPDRISAIVSDSAANVRNARALINKKYPQIENIRCISHCINLIASDIVGYAFADRLLRRVNILASAFRNSHLVGKYLNIIMYINKIKVLLCYGVYFNY